MKQRVVTFSICYVIVVKNLAVHVNWQSSLSLVDVSIVSTNIQNFSSVITTYKFKFKSFS